MKASCPLIRWCSKCKPPEGVSLRSKFKDLANLLNCLKASCLQSGWISELLSISKSVVGWLSVL